MCVIFLQPVCSDSTGKTCSNRYVCVCVCVIHLKARDLPTPCMVRVVDYIFEYERAAIFNMIQLVRTGLMFFSLPGLMF